MEWWVELVAGQIHLEVRQLSQYPLCWCVALGEAEGVDAGGHRVDNGLQTFKGLLDVLLLHGDLDGLAVDLVPAFDGTHARVSFSGGDFHLNAPLFHGLNKVL